MSGPLTTPLGQGKRTYAPDPKVKERGPKKQARTIDRKATTRAVIKRRACGICGQPAATGHHVLKRGAPHFGDDLDANIVSLCGSGTTGCHGLVENENRAARKSLGEHLSADRPDTVFYVLEKLGDTPGRDWLKRRLYLTV